MANGIRIFPEPDNLYAIYASFYQNVLIDCTAAIAVIDNKPQRPAPMNSMNVIGYITNTYLPARLPCAPQGRVTGTSWSRIPGATSSRRVKFAADVQIGRGTRLTQ